MNRSHFAVLDSATYLWTTLGLPVEALDSLNLVDDGEYLPSSFKVDHLAQSFISVSALSAALFRSLRNHTPVPKVTVSAEHACVEFKSERLYTLDGRLASPPWGTIGGLHKTNDGYVRMHDSFPNHRSNALKILGLAEDATREDVAKKVLEQKSLDMENEAFRKGAVIVALRSFEQWDKLPQAEAVADEPVLVKKVSDTAPYAGRGSAAEGGKCLQEIRVVEMSRVIAAPVAGKTLAAHGADVIWVTSPTLPDLPDLDRDLARGKRTIQLDIKKHEDKEALLELLRTADVFLQSYRPRSLASHGLSKEELVKANPNLIVANLSAWGLNGVWSTNRGFDSLVQACSGINVAEAERYGAGEASRVLPCQALDHGAGYLLATSIIAALYRRATDGGAYEVHVSLAGVMKYLRSLGQYPGKHGFKRRDFTTPEQVEKYLEARMTDFGMLKAVKHSAAIQGVEVGWDIMPKPLGSDEAVWLE
ncbi:CoA-transferase family III [Lophiostoma macrostomum CBS 122681]|uniref:CoA-transferase family III n=1 Tax=Lophiostoma macrostomum CBS 122681 TaxID=1314788 RepID=A0A6A6SS92_9PLEO|nr:CoA-transferase family III [Lophiostoma macrostomum CBS 122681]